MSSIMYSFMSLLLERLKSQVVADMHIEPRISRMRKWLHPDCRSSGTTLIVHAQMTHLTLLNISC
jgi:hypothetical protein